MNINKRNAKLIINLLEYACIPDLCLHRFRDILDELGLSYYALNSKEYGIKVPSNSEDLLSQNLMKVLTRGCYDHEC